MSLQNLLKQVLQTAQQHIQPTASTDKKSQSSGFSLGSFAGGAASGSVLTLLLGNKKFRKMGGKVAMYGGVAAAGALAYKAYGEWKQKSSDQPAAVPVAPSFEQLPAPVLEQQSRLILSAMVAAAKADGHISTEEQQLIDHELAQMNVSDSDKQWFNAQLQGPADPAAIARLANTPEEKAEVYLISVLVTGADTFMEKAYLDELSKQLQLEPDLKAHLEQTALQAAAQQ